MSIAIRTILLALVVMFTVSEVAVTQTNLPWQSDNYEIRHFSRLDGMTHRNVIDLKRGQSGRLWVATQSGLNYYDGNVFRELMVSDDEGEYSLVNARLVVDEEDQIWAMQVYAEDRRPILIEDKNGRIPDMEGVVRQYTLPENGTVKKFCRLCFERSEQGKKAKALLLDKIGKTIEVSPKWGFYNLLDSMYGDRPVNFNREIDAVLSMEDNSYVYFYPGRGFVRIDLTQSTVQLFETTNDGQRFEDFWYKAVPVDPKGYFWYPSHVQKDSLVLRSFSTQDHLPEPAFQFFIDDDLRYWVFSATYKQFLYQPKNELYQSFSFDIGRFNFTLYDDEGILWLGIENGLSRVTFPRQYFRNIGSKPFQTNEPAPISRSIRTMVRTKNDRYLFYENFGAVYEVVDKEDILPYVNKEPDGITRLNTLSMVYHDYGDFEALILGSENGLFLWDITNDRYKQLPNSALLKNVTVIQYDSLEKAHLLVDEDMSYIWLYSDDFSASEVRRLPSHITNILKITKDHVYATSDRALIKMDRDLKSGTDCFSVKTAFDVEGRNIRDLVIKDGTIWLSSFEGLYGIDSETCEKQYHFDRVSGLPGEMVYSILPTEKGLWLGTDNGLSYLDFEDFSIKSFFEWDGLSHNEFNTYAKMIDEDGDIWMGGLNGINVFDPNKIKRLNFDQASLYLTSIDIFNVGERLSKTIPVHNFIDLPSIRLKPNEKTLQINVSHHALSRSNASSFLWYLEGIEPEWSNTSKEPLIAYRNLSPGMYTLHIRAEDFRGVTSGNSLTLTIEVEQYWYLRSWSIALWFLLLGLIIFAGIRVLFIRKVEKQRVAQLEVLDQQKNNLYTNITHEFRTPLTLILGYAEKVEKLSESSSPDIRKMSSNIRRNGQQLLHLVNQMMDLARLESGEIKVQTKPVQLLPYIKQIAFAFQSMADKKGIKIAFSGDDTLNKAYEIDTDKFQQILSNLISNAIKFGKKNSTVHVTANLEVKERKDKKILKISVQDQGPGIPESELTKIFDRFHRLTSKHSAQYPGSGVGLALAKELTERLSGKITVESKVNIGSIFHIVLPVELAADQMDFDNTNSAIDSEWLPQGEDIAHIIKDEQIADGSSEVTGQRLVLLVEDNQDVLDYLESCISDKYNTVTALNGKEGLEKARQYVPDIIISDVMMPIMDGFTLCTKLKSDRITSHIPIILLTAKTGEESRMKGLTYGADAYLTKPFKEEELLVRIENMLQLIDALKTRFSGFDALSALPPSAPSQEDMFMDEVKDVLKKNYSDEEFNTDDFAAALKMSKSQLYRKLKALTGDTPAKILRHYRLEVAKQLLQSHPNMLVSEVAYACGFNNPKYFSNLFYQAYNIRPGRV